MAKRQKLENDIAQPIQFNLDLEKQAFEGTLQEFHFKMASNEYDLLKVLRQFRPTLSGTLFKGLERFHGLKVSFIVTAVYKSKQHEDAEPFTIYLRATAKTILLQGEVEGAIDELNGEINTRHENIQSGSSNCEIQNIFYLSILLSRFEPLAGAKFLDLPQFLEKKKAIINVRNRDDRCFGYAVLSAILDGSCRPTAGQLSPFFSAYHLNGINYPVEPQAVSALEPTVRAKINIFSFGDDEGKMRYPLYISKYEGDSLKEIDLLYWQGHYAWIKSFSRFIFDVSAKKCKKFFCKRCFSVFVTQSSFAQHRLVCSRANFLTPLYSFPEQGQTLRFQHIRFQLKCPFVIYADFECLLCPVPGEETKRHTCPYEAHKPIAVGFLLKAANPTFFPTRYEQFIGPDAALKFLSRLLEISNELIKFMDDEKRMIMTEGDKEAFGKATHCTICLRPFLASDSEEYSKVRDHDHLTGQFRGAAHSKCNLNFKETRRIPVFIHNFRGYDAHIISLALEYFPEEKRGIIGQGFEKYLILTFSKHIVFKDSFQFMGYSLEALCNELLRSGPEKFMLLRDHGFPLAPDWAFKLLLRKGVFPYEYISSVEKLEETELPPATKFFSTLKQADIDPADYSHARLVWENFNCRTLKEYMELYLKTDVYILADVFENFRSFSLNHYRLDPAHYVSSPHLSWDAMLLSTNEELELLYDSEMFSMIDKGIRGGVSTIVHRYARANNPEMGTSEYVPAVPLSYIVYLDANNLYGWAMSQPLPIDSFEWVLEKDWAGIDWRNLPDEGETGYFLTCDLTYPENLHELHQDYPLAPEKREIHWERYNPNQLSLLGHYAIPRGGLNVPKLICHFLPHMHYTMHYRNLKFYLEEGLQLIKIHQVLKFHQRTWLAPYILMNQDLRAAAKSDFEKNQPKLFNNSIYGKTCENQKKRTDFKLTKSMVECKRLIEKPQMKGWKSFTQNLAVVEMQKNKSMIDKPFYVGFSVLELSKLHMLKFHYRYIKRAFGADAQLLFTDTDSLMYHFKGVNPYAKFFEDRAQYFDFASFPQNSKYYDNTNNKVIGMFKDESNGAPIKEFVGLRPKMYSYLLAGEGKKEKHTLKGVQFAVSKKIRHQEFLDQLDHPHENRLTNRRIGSKLHQIYSFQVNKRGLCAFDDKRIIMDDGITTLPYGHFRVTQAQTAIDDIPMILPAEASPIIQSVDLSDEAEPGDVQEEEETGEKSDGCWPD